MQNGEEAVSFTVTKKLNHTEDSFLPIKILKVAGVPVRNIRMSLEHGYMIWIGPLPILIAACADETSF
jgi:hypothetical protein